MSTKGTNSIAAAPDGDSAPGESPSGDHQQGHAEVQRFGTARLWMTRAQIPLHREGGRP
jgi:hypothetical protein